MFGLAIISGLRNRSGSAVLLVAGVGAVLVSAMAGVLAAGLAPATRAQGRAFLVQFPAIMGGWILAITIFAVVSTVTVALDGRSREIGSLRLTGASPRQIRQLIGLQTGVGSAAAIAIGVLVGYPLDWLIMDRLRAAGLIAAPSSFSPGILLPVVGGLLVLIAAITGGHLGARALATRPLFAEQPSFERKRYRGRPLIAIITLAVGIGAAVSTLALSPDQIYATATTGPGCVLITVGLAALAPEALALGRRLLRVLPSSSRVAGYLARVNLDAAPDRLRPLVTFLTLFVGVSVGTLTMQHVESASGTTAGTMGSVMAAINYFVVALIAAFMAIALINNVVASVRQRRAEFATMSLIGSTGSQIRRMVIIESGVGAGIGGLAGVLAGVLAVVPFALLKTGDVGNSVAGPVLIAVLLAAAVLTGATVILAVGSSVGGSALSRS